MFPVNSIRLAEHLFGFGFASGLTRQQPSQFRARLQIFRGNIPNRTEFFLRFRRPVRFGKDDSPLRIENMRQAAFIQFGRGGFQNFLNLRIPANPLSGVRPQ